MNKLNYISLNFFLSRSIFSIIGINLLFKISSNSIIPSITLGTIIGIIILKFFRLNSFFKNILSAISFPILLYIYSLYIHNTMANNTNIFLIVISIFLLIFYLNKNNESNIRNLSLICFFITFIIGIIILFGTCSNINVNYLNIDSGNIIISSIIYSVITTLPILLINNNKYVFSSYIISSITNLINTILCILNLGYSLSIIYKYPFFKLLNNISFFNIINRIDIFLLIIYLFDGLFLLIITFKFLYNLLTNASISKG